MTWPPWCGRTTSWESGGTAPRRGSRRSSRRPTDRAGWPVSPATPILPGAARRPSGSGPGRPCPGGRPRRRGAFAGGPAPALQFGFPATAGGCPGSAGPRRASQLTPIAFGPACRGAAGVENPGGRGGLVGDPPVRQAAGVAPARGASARAPNRSPTPRTCFVGAVHPDELAPRRRRPPATRATARPPAPRKDRRRRPTPSRRATSTSASPFPRPASLPIPGGASRGPSRGSGRARRAGRRADAACGASGVESA